jgi:hypothetical protein
MAWKASTDSPALQPALVITDIVMPEMDGIEVVMRLRALQAGVKVIAMSGGGQQSVVGLPPSGPTARRGENSHQTVYLWGAAGGGPSAGGPARGGGMGAEVRAETDL